MDMADELLRLAHHPLQDRARRPDIPDEGRRLADEYAGVVDVAAAGGVEVARHLAPSTAGSASAASRPCHWAVKRVFKTRAVNGCGQSILRATSTTVVRMVSSPAAATAAAWKLLGTKASSLARGHFHRNEELLPQNLAGMHGFELLGHCVVL
jgi:hypothetical protein